LSMLIRTVEHRHQRPGVNDGSFAAAVHGLPEERLSDISFCSRKGPASIKVAHQDPHEIEA
jgi:hypothetical protein